MGRAQSAVVQPRSWTALPNRVRIVLFATAALAFCAVAYGANREIAQNLDRQIAQDEGAFCRKLAAGAQFASCMQEISRLLRRVQDARADAF